MSESRAAARAGGLWRNSGGGAAFLRFVQRCATIMPRNMSAIEAGIRASRASVRRSPVMLAATRLDCASERCSGGVARASARIVSSIRLTGANRRKPLVSGASIKDESSYHEFSISYFIHENVVDNDAETEAGESSAAYLIERSCRESEFSGPVCKESASNRKPEPSGKYGNKPSPDRDKTDFPCSASGQYVCVNM